MSPVNARPAPKPAHPFLPTCRADLEARGWDGVDIVIVTGDAYVDHPAFGPPLIARFLEGRGFRVGIIAQPDWHSAEPFKALGKPRLFFGVTAGNMDSMLNRLTAQKKNRSEDQYSPGGRHRLPPGPRDHRLRAALPRGVPRRADRPRRDRGVAPPHRALRLLERQGPPLDPPRQQGRPARLRHGRAADLGDRGSPAPGREGLRAARRPRHRVRDPEGRAARSSRPTRRCARRTGKPVVLPSYEEVSTDKTAFARDERRVPARDEPRQRPAARAARTATAACTSTRPRSRSTTARAPAATRSRWTSSTICRSTARRTRRTGRRSPRSRR